MSDIVTHKVETIHYVAYLSHPINKPCERCADDESRIVEPIDNYREQRV